MVEMAEQQEPKKLHIAMFPWLAFGHLIPYLDVAKLMAQRGHKISFISTPKNIQRLPKIPSGLSRNINFVTLTLPEVENLPAGAEATVDLLSHHQMSLLKAAYDGLQPSMASFLRESTPDWIIYDFSPHWLPAIAADLGISCAFLSIFPAWFLTFTASSWSAMIDGEDEPRTRPEHFVVPPKWVPFPSKVAYRMCEAKRLLDIFEVNDSGVSDVFRAGSVIKGCDVIAVRSCRELESDYLDLLAELHGRPVFPIGLLPPQAAAVDEDPTWIEIRQFLDSHVKESVVFIAFGSELTLSQPEVTELALGLEQSGLPFFWAFKNRSFGSDPVKLPSGFQERIKGRGIVWTSWAPQLRILSHDAVGAFVTHCGFSSVLEGLSCGRPLIFVPFQYDQGLVARVFEEKKVGIEVPRDNDGNYSREAVAQSLRLVVSDEEGEVYREKAKEMSGLFADKNLHEDYMDRFVEFLQKHSSKATLPI